MLTLHTFTSLVYLQILLHIYCMCVYIFFILGCSYCLFVYFCFLFLLVHVELELQRKLFFPFRRNFVFWFWFWFKKMKLDVKSWVTKCCCVNWNTALWPWSQVGGWREAFIQGVHPPRVHRLLSGWLDPAARFGLRLSQITALWNKCCSCVS